MVGLVDETLDALHIKWRPNKPRKPHLNGKVERVQRTDLQEFYATADLSSPIEMLNKQLEGYAAYYNFEHVHGSTGCTPDRRCTERLKVTPFSYEVWEMYDAAAEQARHRFFGMEWMVEERDKHHRL